MNEDELDPRIPNGVLYAPKPEDYVSGDGQIGRITERIFVENGVWSPYIVMGERQSGGGMETNNCTAFGYTNSIEIQFKFMRQHGLIPTVTFAWLADNGYLDSNYDLNISDRALGQMAGSTGQGNYLNKVADTARTMGLVPESKWGFVSPLSEYYKPVPQELKDLAKQFLNYFELPYEQVGSPASPSDLQAAPLYVALATCGNWSKKPNPPAVKWCNATGTNHAVCLIRANDYQIFDSYDPFPKDLATNYQIPYLYRVLLITKGQRNMFLAKDTKSPTVGIVTGNHDKRILAFADVEALGLLGDEPQIPMDFTGSKIYNIVKNDPAHPGQFIIVNK